MNCWQSRLWILGLLLAVLTAGCGEPAPKLVEASGRVIQGGKGLTAGSIWFHPTGGNPHQGEKPSCLLAVDGSFKMRTYPYGDGVPPGDYKVTLAPDLANRVQRPELGNVEKTTWSVSVPESGVTGHVFEVK
jgi:hypothetical protein